MLRDRYEIDKFFMEIQSLASEMDPELTQIDAVLEDDAIFQWVKGDLAQRYPQTLQTGRYSTPVEVILRMLVVRRLYDWSYEATERHVSDSLVLRRFCRVYFASVPDDTALIRWAAQIKPETLEALNGRVTAIATALKVTRGRKLRTDGTVVESNIHQPSDSSLLADSVRVLSRTIKRAQGLLQGVTPLAKATFRDRTRSAKRTARQISQKARQGLHGVKHTYQRLVTITQSSVRQAQQVGEALEQVASARAQALQDTLQVFLARAEQVIDQTVRRVFQDEQVPATQKIVSIFEAHTEIIKRGKVNPEVEFGHKLWLDEVEGGIISAYRILHGDDAADSRQWQPSLDHHVQQFGHPPHQASADRGVYSAANEAYAAALGVHRIVLPQAGAKSTARRQHERQPWFWRIRRWHAGIEGRISVLKRKYGLRRCRDRGEEGFQHWVGLGIIVANLAVIGRTLARG
jgi:IS5 family transposase